MLMTYLIKLADENDIKDVFDLSNDDEVRKNSINQGKIQWENHVNWYSTKIKDKNCKFYIIRDENNDFIGQMRIDSKDNENIISISIKKEFRGNGLAPKILSDCIKKSNLRNFDAYIKPENIASIKSFIHAGFKYKCDYMENTLLLKKYILEIKESRILNNNIF